MSKKKNSFIFTGNINPEMIMNEISSNFICKTEACEIRNETYFDTFDWRLYQNKFALLKIENRWILYSLTKNDSFTGTTKKTKRQNYKPEDFLQEQIKRKLCRLIHPRVLLPVINIQTEETQIKILDSQQNPVIILYLRNSQIINKNAKKSSLKLPAVLIVQEINNLKKEFRSFVDFLKQKGLIEAEKNWNIFQSAIKIKKINPFSSLPKVNISLKLNEPARNVSLKIFRYLLRVAEKNIEGIRNDTDTEFLHDFRVSIRRLRTLLGQLKNVFPLELVNESREILAGIMKKSNDLRDLDVYSEKKEYYSSLLPENMRKGLEIFFTRLSLQRKTALNILTEYLCSAECKESFSKLKTTFLQKDLPQTKYSSVPVKILASRFILKKFRKIIRQIYEMDDRISDEELHKIRISCKNLRYLLEFFSSLYPEKQISSIINRLKYLQDILGRHNDLSVQEKYLKDYLAQLEYRESGSREITLIASSLGGLIVNLSKLKENERTNLTHAFNSFCEKKNLKLYKKLFDLPEITLITQGI